MIAALNRLPETMRITFVSASHLYGAVTQLSELRMPRKPCTIDEIAKKLVAVPLMLANVRECILFL